MQKHWVLHEKSMLCLKQQVFYLLHSVSFIVKSKLVESFVCILPVSIWMFRLFTRCPGAKVLNFFFVHQISFVFAREKNVRNRFMMTKQT